MPRWPARDARPPAASRRSTGRRPRRGRSGSPVRPGGARAAAATGRRPGPRRRAGSSIGLASARAEASSAPRADSASPTRSSKSSPPRSVSAASYATNAWATGPAATSAATSAAVTPRSSFSRENAVSSRPRSAIVVRGHSSASSAARSISGSTGRPASRRISRPRAWKVRTRTTPVSKPSGARAASVRSASSSAARLLKVIAVIDSGSAPSSTSHAIRATSVVVFPLPAGATHSTGPGAAVAAAR